MIGPRGRAASTDGPGRPSRMETTGGSVEVGYRRIDLHALVSYVTSACCSLTQARTHRDN